MADSYLEEQIKKIEEFRIRLVFSQVNDSNHHRELQAEFTDLSTLPKRIKDMMGKHKDNLYIQSLYRQFTKQCFSVQFSLNKLLFKIHKQNYSNNYNSDFNYLYNDDENLNGIEIYIYDIKTHNRTSTNKIKSYKNGPRLLDKIGNIMKISDSHLLIMGKSGYESKSYLMDLKTKEVSEINIFDGRRNAFDKNYQFIYYENYIFVFDLYEVEKYNINLKRWHRLQSLVMKERVFAVLFQNYVLLANFQNSNLYLYDLLIEYHSDITFFENMNSRKFLFTDQERVYIWIPNHHVYESDINNPFKWNIIGENNFGIHHSPYDIAFSNFEGNIYASLIMRPMMYCYKFNRERKGMELIYQQGVNR